MQGGTEEGLRTSPVALVKVADLERQLAAANEKPVRREEGSLFDLKLDSIDDIATVVVATASENRARNLGNAIIKKVKREQGPAG